MNTQIFYLSDELNVPCENEIKLFSSITYDVMHIREESPFNILKSKKFNIKNSLKVTLLLYKDFLIEDMYSSSKKKKTPLFISMQIIVEK